VHCVLVKASHPVQETELVSAVRITLVPARKSLLQLAPLKQEMPDGLEDTKRFLIPVESTTVSVNDEEPETVTVTESEAVCGPLELKKILLLP
jgi:hypothetical protein